MTDITAEMIRPLIKQRPAESHKDHYGRVLAVCGSTGYTGAAYFAAQSAVRTGSGVVTLAIPESVYPILAVKLNEPVVRPLPCDANGQICLRSLGALLCMTSRSDALLIGCGLGRSEEATRAVLALLRAATCPVVVDADGINALAEHIDVLRQTRWPVILTPHKGEFARLSGVSPEKADQGAASLFAVKNRCFIVLKSHRTIIAAPDGTCLQNTTGNPGMAKGGSGDVLAGMVLSLLGQRLKPLDACCAGVFLHGAAGDRCANRLGEFGMTPTDLLREIPAVMKCYNSREW